MKKFFALLLTLVLMFSCATALADVQLLSKHDNLDAITALDTFSIANLKKSTTIRAALVLGACLDLMANSILDEAPDSANHDLICVGLKDDDDLSFVFIPLEDEILVLMSITETDLYGYDSYSIDIDSKSIMSTFMDLLIENETLDRYWFVSADDIVEVATAISN